MINPGDFVEIHIEDEIKLASKHALKPEPYRSYKIPVLACNENRTEFLVCVDECCEYFGGIFKESDYDRYMKRKDNIFVSNIKDFYGKMIMWVGAAHVFKKVKVVV